MSTTSGWRRADRGRAPARRRRPRPRPRCPVSASGSCGSRCAAAAGRRPGAPDRARPSGAVHRSLLERYPRQHLEAAAVPRPGVQLTTVERDPLPHAEQAVPGPAAVRDRRAPRPVRGRRRVTWTTSSPVRYLTAPRRWSGRRASACSSALPGRSGTRPRSMPAAAAAPRLDGRSSTGSPASRTWPISSASSASPGCGLGRGVGVRLAVHGSRPDRAARRRCAASRPARYGRCSPRRHRLALPLRIALELRRAAAAWHGHDARRGGRPRRAARGRSGPLLGQRGPELRLAGALQPVGPLLELRGVGAAGLARPARMPHDAD